MLHWPHIKWKPIDDESHWLGTFVSTDSGWGLPSALKKKKRPLWKHPQSVRWLWFITLTTSIAKDWKREPIRTNRMVQSSKCNKGHVTKCISVSGICAIAVLSYVKMCAVVTVQQDSVPRAECWPTLNIDYFETDYLPNVEHRLCSHDLSATLCSESLTQGPLLKTC